METTVVYMVYIGILENGSYYPILRDSIGDYYRSFEGHTRSLDYSSCGACQHKRALFSSYMLC